MELAPAPRNRLPRLRGLLVNTACALVCLVAAGFILPAAFGLERYVIAGRSMTGTINQGSVVFDEVVPVSDLRVGDVITYVPPAESGIDHPVTHRIISRHGDVFRTKGDHNAQRDPWTFKLTSGTQARVAYHVPYVGWIFLALQDRMTRVLVIGIPAGLIALMSLRELVRGLRRPTRQRRAKGGSPETEDRESPLGGPAVPWQRREDTVGGRAHRGPDRATERVR